MSDDLRSEIGEVSEVPESFALLVRDALAHLYDYAHLQRHPLNRLVTTDVGPAQDVARSLRALLLDTIEQLNPGDGVSRNDKEWRPYGILLRRYVDGFDDEQISRELGISLRQFQRDHRKGLLALAAIFWRRWEPLTAELEPAERAATHDNLQQEMSRLGLALERADLGILVASVLEPAQALAADCHVALGAASSQRAALAWADLTLARQALLGALSALITSRPARIDITWQVSQGSAALSLALYPPLPAEDAPASQELAGRLGAARELMNAQGGHLELVSGLEGLTAIRLSFRLAQGARVLLIDDNASLLQLFERYLVADGYRVTCASGSGEALPALAKERPEVIVLDVMMRDMDGWELLQRLRANPDLQAVPIGVCSVLNERELALALGARFYLKKPVSQQQLLAALRQALDENSPAALHPEAP